MIRKAIFIAAFFFAGKMLAQRASLPSYQEFFIKDITIPSANYNSYLLGRFNLSSEYAFVTNTSTTLRDELGVEHVKAEQFFRNIKIEDAVVNLHISNGTIISVNGEYLSGFSNVTTPSISEAAAFDLAVKSVGATQYVWQDKASNTARPIGKLVITKNITTATSVAEYKLAYKYDIYATVPMSRRNIYIDAISGVVLRSDNLIQECFKAENNLLFAKKPFVLGTAQTRYSGSRQIETTNTGSGYNLVDITRGLGVETYNLNQGTNYSAATNFIDNDNNWTAAEWDNTARDNAALDAHWGAEKTYDYFYQKHGRNSYNNAGAKIKSYVHYSSNYFNAFWNGSVMTYGDGSSMNNNNPLTSVDIAAHEIGHAVCTHSAGLVYSYEPGALNESFSDIWGACVEYFADPTKQTWELGEDIQYIIRSFSNPNAHNQPDTYLGTYWYTGSGDNGGVHTNSGVQNFWFYLLSMGGAGSNDFGTAYNVNGIGIEKAAKIAYRAETVYLTSSSNYNAARTYSIKAAEDLYGIGSPEARSTEKAWCAVGVGTCPCLSNVIITGNYTVPVTESSTWIKSNGVTTILNGTIVKLDADPNNGYVQFTDGFSTQPGAVLIAKALDGCGAALPAKQNTQNQTEQTLTAQDELTTSELKIYPNPTTGNFTISNNSKIELVEVYDLTGKVVFRKENSETSITTIDIDLTKYNAGIYLVRINNSTSKKVVKE